MIQVLELSTPIRHCRGSTGALINAVGERVKKADVTYLRGEVGRVGASEVDEGSRALDRLARAADGS